MQLKNVEDSPTSNTPPKPRRWISEFALIVAGVSVALAADSLWKRWEDSRAEGQYIQQLVAEVQENTKRLKDAIALEQSQRGAAVTAFRAIARGDDISRDSAVSWAITRRGLHYSDPRLLTGTVTALISTGDLALLRGPGLRQAIAAYMTQIQEDRAEFDRAVQIHISSYESLRAAAFGTRSAHLTESDTVFISSAVAALTGRPGKDVLFAVDGVISSNFIRVIYLERMLATNERLGALIGAH